MKKLFVRLLAFLLCGAMLFGMSDSLIAFALDDPTDDIVLTVPETLRGGELLLYPRGFHGQ